MSVLPEESADGGRGENGRRDSDKTDQLKRLRRVFGDRLILGEEADPRALDRYATDQVGDDRYRVRPAAVCFPTATDEVVSLMEWANETKTPVTPRGAGSGLAGAAVPVEGGVVCSFEKMNRILEIDEANLMATVEPGVVTNALDEALEESGLFFAGYPMSEDICFIGGNVAENAGGGRAVKYGVTSQYVLGAEIVTPTGSVLRLGGKRLKDVTGYNLLPLFIGSEGTLGLFTSITLRLVPRPAQRAVMLVAFPSATDAAEAVATIKRSAATPLSSVELMDGPTARSTNDAMPRASRTPLADRADAYLLVELDGDAERDFDRGLRSLTTLVATRRGTVIEAGTDRESMDRGWRVRKQVQWWVKRVAGQYHSLEDVVVPPATVADLVSFVGDLRKRFEVPIALFGHAGDGNFHVTPMKPDAMSTGDWKSTIDSLLRALYRRVDELGGTISGEHGIGRKRVSYLADFSDPAEIDLMRQVKAILDPNAILNPGVVLSGE